MAIQTATTGQLENAQGTIISKARYTAEHNAPVAALFERFILAKGNSTITVPKVGQVTFADLFDGVDMVDTEDIGMTTVDLTTSELGAKFILTDKLVRQENEDVFKMVGRQLGDGYARKTDTDGIALFTNFNAGTALGADNKGLNMMNLSACIAYAKAQKYPSPVVVVHHPNAIYEVARNMGIVGQTVSGAAGAIGTAAAVLPGGDKDRAAALKDFYKFTFNGVQVFEDGNIAKESGADSGKGAIFSRSAGAYTVQLGFTSGMEHDNSLRATEVVAVGDQSFTELDDGYGAPMQYEIGTVVTNA